MGMNPGMKMMLLQRTTQDRSGNASEYGAGNGRRMIGYDRPENTYRDRDNDGRYNENRRAEYNGYAPENRRRRDSRGRYAEGDGWEDRSYNGDYQAYGYGMETENRRRRDSRGRYMMEEIEDDDEDPRHRAKMMEWPPRMSGSRYGIRDVYADIHTGSAQNRPMNNMYGGDMSEPVDEQTARSWVRKMDGGEHFNAEQTDAHRMNLCPDCNKWEWYTAMNAMYSDHCETAKKINMDKPEFYAHLAKDFLKDADAKPNKLRRYMEHIAK